MSVRETEDQNVIAYRLGEVEKAVKHLDSKFDAYSTTFATKYELGEVKKDVELLQKGRTWLFRTVTGAIILALIGIIITTLSATILHDSTNQIIKTNKGVVR